MQYDIWTRKHVRRRVRWDGINKWKNWSRMSFIWILPKRRKAENERRAHADGVVREFHFPIEEYTFQFFFFLSIFIEWDLISIFEYRITVNRLLKCQQTMNNGDGVLKCGCQMHGFPFIGFAVFMWLILLLFRHAIMLAYESVFTRKHTLHEITSGVRDFIATPKCKGCPERKIDIVVVATRRNAADSMRWIPFVGIESILRWVAETKGPASCWRHVSSIRSYSPMFLALAQRWRRNAYSLNHSPDWNYIYDDRNNWIEAISRDTSPNIEHIEQSNPAAPEEEPRRGTFGIHCRNRRYRTIGHCCPLSASRARLKCKCALFVIYLQCSMR